MSAEAFDRLVIRHCAPTLAGLKTAGLFTCPARSGGKIDRHIRAWNERLRGQGVLIEKLREKDGRALVFVYRENGLRQVLSERGVRRFLLCRGYLRKDIMRCVARLRKKLAKDGGFPHEIGVFLGYPLRDVRGFIENGGRGCTMSGCWKVYGDEQEAESAFRKYARCKAVYERQYERGRPVEKLIVNSNI